MSTTQSKTGRIYSFDSLRAIMMLLGLVLHSAIPYVLFQYSVIFDPNPGLLYNDYLVDLIHKFRMPIFFFVAGFFGAMLFYERQPLKMIKNRISRIVYPFIVFLFILWPLNVFTTSYATLRFSGSADAFAIALSKFNKLDTYIPQETVHLWFLYYLILITCTSILLGLALKKLTALTSRITLLFNWIIERPVLRVLVFAGLTSMVYEATGSVSIYFSPSFKPELNTFLQYFIFYIVGWFLFQSKNLLDKLMRFDWLCSILAVILFTTHFLMPDHMFMSESYNYHMNVIIKSIDVWLFVFGITGLFLRYGSNYSLRMQYISDASYWVYLIHFSLTIFLAGIIYKWPLHATLKFTIVFITTTTVCFITYHYLVRATFIGKFLNGRKYPRKDTTEVKIRIMANNSKSKKSYLNK